MSFNWWMDKQAVVHPQRGILLSNKKEDTPDACNKLDESPEYYVDLKKKNLETLHTVWSHLYNVLEMIKL